MLKRSYRETQGLKGGLAERSRPRGWLETRLPGAEGVYLLSGAENAALLAEKYRARWGGQPYCSTNG